jgi:uncharacterized protein (DUF697 family)
MDNSQALTIYESAQVTAIKAWKKEEPSVLSKATGVVAAPLAWLVQKVIPEKAIQSALEAANWAGCHLADSGDILRDGGVDQIAELRSKSLQLSDRLANEAHNWAIGMATVEGGATGAFGLPGMAADIPAIVTLALRTVHKIGLCYGYESSNEEDKSFVLGILSASGANSVEDKVEALLALRSIQQILINQTWKKMSEKAAIHQMSKEGAIIGVRNVAKQLGINLTKRKALQAIPFIGAGVGASMNAWYIKDVGWAARRVFQERWLAENSKVVEL